MTQNLPPELELEEGEVEALFARFRIPPREAQEMLEQTLVTLYLRYPDLRHPGFWVLQTLKRRCVLWWRRRNRQLYRIADIGFRQILTSSESSRAEREQMRENLRRWSAAVRPRSREVLSRRYGLAGGEVTAPPELSAEQRAELDCVQQFLAGVEAESAGPMAPSPEVLSSIGALMRRMRAESRRRDADRGDPDAAEGDGVSDGG